MPSWGYLPFTIMHLNERKIDGFRSQQYAQEMILLLIWTDYTIADVIDYIENSDVTYISDLENYKNYFRQLFKMIISFPTGRKGDF